MMTSRLIGGDAATPAAWALAWSFQASRKRSKAPPFPGRKQNNNCGVPTVLMLKMKNVLECDHTVREKAAGTPRYSRLSLQAMPVHDAAQCNKLATAAV
jgi:hypothetical protein